MAGGKCRRSAEPAAGEVQIATACSPICLVCWSLIHLLLYLAYILRVVTMVSFLLVAILSSSFQVVILPLTACILSCLVLILLLSLCLVGGGVLLSSFISIHQVLILLCSMLGGDSVPALFWFILCICWFLSLFIGSFLLFSLLLAGYVPLDVIDFSQFLW